MINTGKALEALGSRIERTGEEWCIKGRGVGGLRQPDTALDFGNSGTGTRLMLGVIAGHDITARLIGDASLSRRPMGRVLRPLKQMGLEVEDDRERLPLVVARHLEPRADRVRAPRALRAGEERDPHRRAACGGRDHRHRGRADARSHRADAPLFRRRRAIRRKDGRTRITVKGDAELAGRDVTVPGDPSSAAFVAAAALLVPGLRRDDRGRADEPDAHRLLPHAARDGRQRPLAQRARGERRARRRSSACASRA